MNRPICPVLPLIDLNTYVLGAELYRSDDVGDYQLEEAVTRNARYLLELDYSSNKWARRSTETGFRRGRRMKLFEGHLGKCDVTNGVRNELCYLYLRFGQYYGKIPFLPTSQI